jgi:hypothetical protein
MMTIGVLSSEGVESAGQERPSHATSSRSSPSLLAFTRLAQTLHLALCPRPSNFRTNATAHCPRSPCECTLWVAAAARCFPDRGGPSMVGSFGLGCISLRLDQGHRVRVCPAGQSGHLVQTLWIGTAPRLPHRCTAIDFPHRLASEHWIRFSCALCRLQIHRCFVSGVY